MLSNGKTLRQNYRDAMQFACAFTPTLRQAIDPTGTTYPRLQDRALRNLFDKLAERPVGFDVLKTCKGIGGNLYDLLVTLYNSPSNGRDALKGFLGQLYNSPSDGTPKPPGC